LFGQHEKQNQFKNPHNNGTKTDTRGLIYTHIEMLFHFIN
jgi:hypothetical protein